MTGHTLGAAGLTSLVLSLESLRLQTCFPTLRSTPLDPSIDIRVVTAAMKHPLRHILINAFAFGGNNCSAVVSAASVSG
jgi:3-oxoacyl-(acyl-carrier-protein) synthase